MASSLRPRSKIDYKALNVGKPMSIKKDICKTPAVLEETYYVERFISRRRSQTCDVSITLSLSLSLSLSLYGNVKRVHESLYFITSAQAANVPTSLRFGQRCLVRTFTACRHKISK